MYQSLVEGRPVPWDLLVVNVPPEKHRDLDYLVDMLDFEENCDPHFGQNHHLVPVADTSGKGYVDRWVCYVRKGAPDLFSAKELSIEPGAKATIKDNGAYGLIVMQGQGRIGKVTLDCPGMIRYGQMTEDEVFVTHDAARAGIVFENTSPCEPLVTLRYFGPDTNPAGPLPPPEGGMIKPMVFVGTKADAAGASENRAVLEALRPNLGPILATSAETGAGLAELGWRPFKALRVVRVYSKEPGEPADLRQPFIVPRGSTVMDLAETIHRELAQNLKRARIRGGGGGKYDGQAVQRDHVLADKDVIELYV